MGKEWSIFQGFWRYEYVIYFFVLRPLFPYGGGRTWALSSVYKTDQAEFTDWMPFLPSNLNRLYLSLNALIKPIT